MSPDPRKELSDELPLSGSEAPVIQRNINGTTYLIRIHFNPDSKETLQDKLRNMLLDEINHPDPET